MQDELRERGVEATVGVGQLLGVPHLRVDARQALANRVDELWRRVDGRDVLGAHATHELGGQRARPAADVEDGLARLDPRRVRERAGELRRVATHEAVVDVAGDRERPRSACAITRAHGQTLRSLVRVLVRLHRQEYFGSV